MKACTPSRVPSVEPLSTATASSSATGHVCAATDASAARMYRSSLRAGMTTETSGCVGEEGAIRHRASLPQQTREHLEDAMARLCVRGALGMEEHFYDRDSGGHGQERPPPQPHQPPPEPPRAPRAQPPGFQGGPPPPDPPGGPA